MRYDHAHTVTTMTKQYMHAPLEWAQFYICVFIGRTSAFSDCVYGASVKVHIHVRNFMHALCYLYGTPVVICINCKCGMGGREGVILPALNRYRELGCI